IDFPYAVNNIDEHNQVTQAVIFENRKDDDPTGSVTFTGDTALYTEAGPLAGHRYALSYSYTPDFKSGTDTVGFDLQGRPITIKRGGTLTQSLSLDFRQYFRITKRSALAFRAFGVRSTGTIPDISYFGGIDTVRAYDFRSEIGTEVAFGNLEYRFPLIDRIILFGGLPLSNIRGKVFVDVGAARLDFGAKLPWQFWNGSGHSITVADPVSGEDVTYKPYQLINGKADYGWGFTLNLLGLDLHWDFAKRWDFRRTLSSFRTSFYIGAEF
ncbi:MAG TPA: hypothetical protein VG777_01470, partial [Thermoanaerobaculia bacterium]|nr:hypothetical protein [Thermoanaerobaculia bacterium]